jgi:hypothetical protein
MQANAAVRAAAAPWPMAASQIVIILRRLSRVCDARTHEIRFAAER